MSTAANNLPATASPVESAVLRAVLGNFCTGVTVITAHDGAQPRGFACQSVTSLSLDPPYVSFCPAGTSTSWPAMREAGRTCVNVLAADQQDVCGRFASTGGDKFAGLEWGYGGNSAPTLPGAIARIEADLEVSTKPVTTRSRSAESRRWKRSGRSIRCCSSAAASAISPVRCEADADYKTGQ